MKLAKYKLADGTPHVARVEGERLIPIDLAAGGMISLAQLLDQPDVAAAVDALPTLSPLEIETTQLLPPIDQQEVWAAGVTYLRSQAARMEESESAAAASCYDRVYLADRPELFFKATPSRVRGPGQPLRIRWDAKWNVPEPEITLVLNRRMEIVGFTIGNDMSSRDIEGENPLYLPQAKLYDGCAGLGPWITLAADMPPRESMDIHLWINRGSAHAFEGHTSADQMARSFEDLVAWLARDNDFPDGAFLMTGTGIVPNTEFTLLPGDIVNIDIRGIGTLSNPIIQG